MMFNATFNNISAISWRSVLLVEETGVLGEKKNTDLSQATDKFDHIMLYQVHFVWAGFKLTTLVVIGTDYTGKVNRSKNQFGLPYMVPNFVHQIKFKRFLLKRNLESYWAETKSRTHGQMDQRTYVCMYVCMYACMYRHG